MIVTYQLLLQTLVHATETLKLYDEASLQQISWHSSNRNLEALQLEVNDVCIALRDPQVSLRHRYSGVDVLVKWPSVFHAVWHASQTLAYEVLSMKGLKLLTGSVYNQ